MMLTQKFINRWLIAILLAILLAGLGTIVHPARANEHAPPLQTIAFSQPGQVSRQPILLTLTNLTGGTIRYTTNGSLPAAGSTPYTAPIHIAQNTVIRAQVFGPDGRPVGPVVTRSYIIAGYRQTIPVLSIVTNWSHLDALHNFPQGRGKAWERPVNLEFFEPGGVGQFNVPAGIRIHGAKSRWFSPKKSYRIYFRKSYGGPGNLEYPLFEDTLVTKFDKLILRAGFNDSFTYVDSAGLLKSQAFTAKYIGDQVTRNLHRNMGQPIAHGRWVLVYLNGHFWGLYNLTERVDLQFLRTYSDKDADWDVIHKESGFDQEGLWVEREVPIDGSDWPWLENQAWVGSADFTNPGNIGVLEWRVDMENVFSYMFLQAYVQNHDWPGKNWIVYRRADPGAVSNESKWRMMIWDAEYSFGSGSGGYAADRNTLQRVYGPHDSITRILEKPFIGNCALKHRFVNRAREYLGVENLHGKPETEVGQLAKERVKAEIIKQAEIVRPYMQMEIDRWAPTMTIDIFEQNIQNTLNFVDIRQDVILHHLDILRYQTFTECR